VYTFVAEPINLYPIESLDRLEDKNVKAAQ
jgi:hypothetical protein